MVWSKESLNSIIRQKFLTEKEQIRWRSWCEKTNDIEIPLEILHKAIHGGN